MARPKTPTKILDARGAFKKDPQRARDDEPEGNGEFPFEPPARLNTLQVEIWHEFKDQVPAGVLTGSDVGYFTIMVELMAEWRAGLMSDARLSKLLAVMGKFGLNPSERAGLTVPKKTTNPFADL